MGNYTDPVAALESFSRGDATKLSGPFSSNYTFIFNFFSLRFSFRVNESMEQTLVRTVNFSNSKLFYLVYFLAFLYTKYSTLPRKR